MVLHANSDSPCNRRPKNTHKFFNTFKCSGKLPSSQLINFGPVRRGVEQNIQEVGEKLAILPH